MSKMQKYKMKRVMEDGVKAVLHEAKNVKKDEMVIIKELKKKFYTQEDCNSCKEVQIQNKMKHENILKMLEMFNDDRELLMVYEHMPENMKRVMKKRDKPFSEPETKGIMSQLLSAVAFIHKLGYIHCNLKPENMLCNEEGTVVKITDFSLAKSISDSPFAELNVQPTWYTAPEALMGSDRYSTPVDIWSAGCIMAELMSGKPLLAGDSAQTQMLKICDFFGTFTRSEWPEGMSLLFNINYNLPKNASSQGFSNMKFVGSSDAKEMIIDMLKWDPVKRKTADQCVNDSFFGGGGKMNGVKAGSPDVQILKLEGWKQRWSDNIASQSIEEFDQILKEIATSRQPDAQRGGDPGDRDYRGGGRMSGKGRNGQENGMQLDLTQRNGHDSPGNFLETERGNVDTQRNNMEMSWNNNLDARINNMEYQRNSMDAQRNKMNGQIDHMEQKRNGFEDRRNNLEEEAIERQERRARPTIVNDDNMFEQYFGDAPGNDKGANQGQGQVRGQGQSNGQGPTQGQGQGQVEEPRYNARGIPQVSRADRLKKDNPVKYNTIYGSGLNFVLGGQNDQKTDIYGNTDQVNPGGQQNKPANNGAPNLANGQQSTNYGQSKQQQNSYNNQMQGQNNIQERGSQNQSIFGNESEKRPARRELNEIKFRDHESEAQQLYLKNPVKYKMRYGDSDLRQILGNKPPGGMKLPDEGADTQPGKSKYTPTWAENGKAGRGVAK